MSKLLNANVTAMKKLRDKIEHYILRTENYWKVLPVDRQRFLTKVFFGVYVLLTVMVIISVFISTSQRRNTMSINHIDGISMKPIKKVSGQNDTAESLIKK